MNEPVVSVCCLPVGRSFSRSVVELVNKTFQFIHLVSQPVG